MKEENTQCSRFLPLSVYPRTGVHASIPAATPDSAPRRSTEGLLQGAPGRSLRRRLRGDGVTAFVLSLL